MFDRGIELKTPEQIEILKDVHGDLLAGLRTALIVAEYSASKLAQLYDKRRGDMVGMLMELKARIDGSIPVQEQFALPQMFNGRQISNGVSEEMDYLFQRGPH